MAEVKKEFIKIIAVVGPTASGKTKLAIEIAKKYNGEIISADSMQVYNGMKIATATPSEKEKDGIQHHLMSFLNPSEKFSVAQYVKLAHETARDICKRGKTPILVGGTGLYIDSFLNNTNFGEINIDENRKLQLENLAEEKGGELLHAMLKKVDPALAESLHVNQADRIIRGILVFESTNQTLSKYKDVSHDEISPYNPLIIGLNARSREYLYDRINKRVDAMVQNGLIEEAKKYYNENLSQTASEAIGHKELYGFIDGLISKEEALSNLKMKTRRYAKRQLTWFRKNKKINWIYIDEYDSFDEIIEKAFDIINKNSEFI